MRRRGPTPACVPASCGTKICLQPWRAPLAVRSTLSPPPPDRRALTRDARWRRMDGGACPLPPFRVRTAADKEHIDDMINLTELSEQSVLNNLKARYRKEIIYVSGRRATTTAWQRWHLNRASLPSRARLPLLMPSARRRTLAAFSSRPTRTSGSASTRMYAPRAWAWAASCSGSTHARS